MRKKVSLMKKVFCLILLFFFIVFSIGCGKTQRALEESEGTTSQSITYSDSPHAKDMAAVAFGLGEFLGLKQPGQGANGGVGALAIYVRSNSVPKFYDDKNILAVDISGPNGDWYQQDYPVPGDPPAEDSNGTYRVNKLFRYNPVGSVPINHDQGTFTREMYTSVTRNPDSALSWRNRTSHSIINRTATLVTYNSVNPPVQFAYIQKEEDDQSFGEGRIVKADGTVFNFSNFEITSEINQDIVPGTVEVAGSISNASYFGEINPNEGIPYLYEDDGQLKVGYHYLQLGFSAQAWIKKPADDDSSWTDTKRFATITSMDIKLTNINKTKGFFANVYAKNKNDDEVSVDWVYIYDKDGNQVYYQNFSHGVVNFSDNYSNWLNYNIGLSISLGANSWNVLDMALSITAMDSYFDQFTRYDDGERDYRVWVDSGRVMYEQTPKGGIAVQYPVSDYVGATQPAINKVGSKIYVTWIQDSNKLYMNVIDLAGSITMTKEGNGSATIDLDYSIDIDADTITGSIHLQNNYTVRTDVTFIDT
ncbi:MAG: hypothetical protein KKA19_07265, partial [Candidatus Margulisbacteria bacterium]|nr:hypothetical protein [Candidatus Margulisiibacteriota bacterium]